MTGPVVVPLGTTAVIMYPVRTLKLVAATPLKVTLFVPVSPWPRICADLRTAAVGITKATNGLSPMLRS